MSDNVHLTEQDALATVVRQLDLEQALQEELLANPNRQKEFFDQLKGLAELPINEDAGAMHVRIGRFHIKLKRLLIDTTIAVAGIALAKIAAPLTWMIVGDKLVAVAGNLHETLKGLDDVEILVYKAIAEIQRNATMPGGGIKIKPGIPRGSHEDIVDHFERRGDMVPPNLADILDNLEKRGVIQDQLLNGETVYSVV